jgi:hypothetical protein
MSSQRNNRGMNNLHIQHTVAYSSTQLQLSTAPHAAAISFFLLMGGVDGFIRGKQINVGAIHTLVIIEGWD